MRRNRLLMLRQESLGEYADIEAVKDEVVAARRLFAEQGWPMIDVTRRSIEETATAIYQLYRTWKAENEADAGAGLPWLNPKWRPGSFSLR